MIIELDVEQEIAIAVEILQREWTDLAGESVYEMQSVECEMLMRAIETLLRWYMPIDDYHQWRDAYTQSQIEKLFEGED